MMEELSKKLDFPFRRNGSLVLCFEEDAMSGLEELYRRGMENGVKELKLLSPEEVWGMEPAVSRDIVGAVCTHRWYRLSLRTEHCTGGECSGEWCGVLSEP